MYFLDAEGAQVDLELVREQRVPRPNEMRGLARVTGDVSIESSAVIDASISHFEASRPERDQRDRIPPIPVFRDERSGLLKTVYREIVVRFVPRTPAAKRAAILRKFRLEVRRRNPLVTGQAVVADRSRRRHGVDLLDVANGLAELDEVRFATPNFVSEYRRTARIPDAQWHLRNTGLWERQVRNGGPWDRQVAGEDVDAMGAWRVSEGRGVVVAVIDDGVDINHPNLTAGIWRNPDHSVNDRFGRDFFISDRNPDHFDPRPKVFSPPYDDTERNDIHGTCCAGVVVARGTHAWGIAPKAKVLAVKVFHADQFAPDEAVANSIRYSAIHSWVVSMSWGGPKSPDVESALTDLRRARGGLGTVSVAAAGNENTRTALNYPARSDDVIAVGASTDQGKRAYYSNRGRELSVVAPSGGGVADINTTDVAAPGRGYNAAPQPKGLETDEFSGTSSATPLVAGIVALMLSANQHLHRDQVREILEATAVKIGRGYDSNGHSPSFGFGRVNAAAAVAAAKATR